LEEPQKVIERSEEMGSYLQLESLLRVNKISLRTLSGVRLAKPCEVVRVANIDKFEENMVIEDSLRLCFPNLRVIDSYLLC
jgi:hypothetical protein